MSEQGILLLGGTGYVGQSLLPRLLQTGHKVYVVARRLDPLPQAPNLIPHWTSLDNPAMLREVLPVCQTVMHLASDSTPGTTAGHPVTEAEHNVLPSLRFLEILQEYRGIHLVFISSGGTVYGNQESTPVNELCPPAPISYHGAGKVAVEAFLHAYNSRSGGAVTILRPSNLYGPGQPYRKGFGIIRTILEHIRRAIPIEIWGDGEIVRDYIYIDDFLKICMQVVKHRSNNRTIDIFNIGSGVGHTINQICVVAESITGINLERTYCSERNIDVRSIVLDTTRVMQQYGWHHDTEIAEGIQSTWQWLQTNSK